jgi:hypothetical protein
VIRPATPDALLRLRAAADVSDRELDRALCDVGVLPPLDLSRIRSLLAQPGVGLSTSRNADGHAIVHVSWGTTRSACIHHDGRVQIIDTAVA